MSKKTGIRCAAVLFAAAVLGMTAALPVLAQEESGTVPVTTAAAEETAAPTVTEVTADADEESKEDLYAADATSPPLPDDPNDVLAGIEYEKTDDGGIRIVKYKWTSAKHIDIPAQIDGLPVTELGEECFRYCYADSVSLPDTIKIIGERAFFFCSYLQSVTIPDGCERIGTHAFDSCEQLKEITIPQSVKFIGFDAFADTPFNDTLTDEFVILGDSFLYRYNGEADNVVIPDTVKAIGEYAFETNGLKSVQIPASVKRIEEFAFSYCESLSKIEVPDSIDYIAANSFANTKWQRDNKDKFVILGPVLMDYQGEDAEVTVPDGIRIIAERVFTFSTELTTVRLPDSVQVIGEGAFARCPNLQIVELGENVEVIGRKAFEACKSLNYLRVGHKLREIGEDAFLECWKLETVYLPDTVEKIGAHAFGYQFGEDADTYLKMDNPLVLYSNTEEVRSYAEEAEVPQEPLPDEQNTKPEPVLTTAPDAAEKLGKVTGKAWIPACILGGVLVLAGGSAAVIRTRKKKD